MSYKETIEDTVVYWYHLAEQKDIFTEGYVGVTNQPKRRHQQHMLNRSKCTVLHRALVKHGDNIIKDIVLSGTREECIAEEIRLRPNKQTGWNIVEGGGSTPDCTGRTHSAETKAKISKGNKGKNLGAKSKFKGITNRYSDEHKKLLGSYHKGKIISQKHRNSITEKLSGKGSPLSRFIVLEHIDKVGETFKFGSIGEAAKELNLTRSALKATVLRKSTSYNKKGWKVLFELSHPKLGQV